MAAAQAGRLSFTLAAHGVSTHLVQQLHRSGQACQAAAHDGNLQLRCILQQATAQNRHIRMGWVGNGPGPSLRQGYSLPCTYIELTCLCSSSPA